MSKIAEITRCRDCPNLGYHDDASTFCERTDHILVTPWDTIPADCPLPDAPDIGKLQAENARLRAVLEKIEWNGGSDYSIGVRTCPYCGRRGGVPKKSKWYQGHSADCEIGKLLEGTK